jgi:predicted MFS family arabinose efflux permease
VSGIFWVTAGLGGVSLVLLFALLPRPPAPMAGMERDLTPDRLGESVWLICISAFLLHMIMTALFVGLPIQMEATTGLDVPAHWRLYLPSLGIAGVLTLGLIFASRESSSVRRLMPSILGLMVSAAAFAGSVPGIAWTLLWLAVFFGAFNLLEATLPALMTRRVGSHRRGAAMGLYATCQFLGAFAGGAGAGAVMGVFGIEGVFWLAAGIGAAWVVLGLRLKSVLGAAERQRFGEEAV